MTPMTNEELAERIRGEDADSIEKLLQNNQEYLYKLARRLSNNPDVIEDLVQEGTIAILDAAGRYDPVQRAMFLTCSLADMTLSREQCFLLAPHHLFTKQCEALWRRCLCR